MQQSVNLLSGFSSPEQMQSMNVILRVVRITILGGARFS